MGLIKKMLKVTAGVGMMIAGLPVCSEALAIGGGVTYKIYKDKLYNAIKGESETKTICVLNEKYENLLEDLNTNSFDFGDVQVKFSPVDELQGEEKYGQMYDNIMAVFNNKKLKISKEEFVNFMLKHGDEVIKYVKSDEFKKRLNNINKNLNMWMGNSQHGPKNQYGEQEKSGILGTFRTEIELDNMFYEHDPNDVRYLRNVNTAGICITACGVAIFGIGLAFAIINVASGCDCEDDGMFKALKYLCAPFLSIMAGGWLADQLNL